MRQRGNTLRLTAVSALVVLTLTGFSAGRGHGGSSGDGGGGGGGGGCSSSSQNHDSSSGSGGGSHRDHGDDDHDGTGGSGGDAGSTPPPLRDAVVDLLTCASQKTGYATVEVTNRNTVTGTFTVTVAFEDDDGTRLVSRTQDVTVLAGETATARVRVGEGTYVTRVAGCDPDPYAPAAL
ncbi:hypothetical protein [Streptomyces sp. SM1]|uniref:hypothetical protein n=1 Tax=Streptomyces sp. SM1 TaxID=402229 RepID=UPI000CD56264|nr:hypothetical protein [Streptomyces sp. SM1]